MSSCWSGGNRSSAHSAARSLRSITPVTTVCQIRASLSSRFRVSSSNSSMNPSISPTIALMQSSTGTGSSDTPGGGPNSGRSPSSTMVSRAVRSGLTAACSAELSPRSKRSRSHSPYCRSKLGGYRQGRTWACATTVTSTQLRAGRRKRGRDRHQPLHQSALLRRRGQAPGDHQDVDVTCRLRAAQHRRSVLVRTERVVAENLSHQPEDSLGLRRRNRLPSRHTARTGRRRPWACPAWPRSCSGAPGASRRRRARPGRATRAAARPKGCDISIT